jgi:hypothetical protein
MALDTIVAYATTAGNMPALAPTSLTIKGNSGDARIVGIAFYSDDATKVAVTCTGDPRWEAAGIMIANQGQGVTCQAGAVEWLPTAVPVKAGATLTVTSTTGTGESYCLIYVDYGGFKVRDPYGSQPSGFEVTKTATAGGALTAFTIAVNSTSITTFQRGRTYTPVMVEGLNAAVTGPGVFVGIQNVQENLATFWNVALTPVKTGGGFKQYLPYGLGTVSGGDTMYVHFLSTTTDTPACNITFAYTA